MIICICNRINEKTARAAVDAGARSPKDVLAHAGCRFNCGKCKCEMGGFIADEVDRRAASPTLVAAE
ncbi:MAG: (2Fe-2S)-binding protein [Pseudomonadota bacterium]